MNIGRYNLKQLLTSSEIEQIIIPEIQRDYVWRKENVTKLLDSIFSNYKTKNTLTLEIKNEGKDIDDSFRDVLSEEYSRLRYNTKIGFIYAYYDTDYPGKFFIIDGQQRITTLFLLLLVLYKLADNSKLFCNIYFKNKIPKLDYKVRELSHDFLVDFISFITDEKADEKFDFKKSGMYYKNLYENDETTRSFLNNIEVIHNYIIEKKLDANKGIEYVENYIEFNYFDTNKSEQGERLYLYMNSRGETLSFQEIVKASTIKKSECDKKEAGRKWEIWQNFFWKNRGNNENADKGFQEFLKWATIIHICTCDNPNLESPSNLEKNISEREKKEYYIKVEKEQNQESLLKKYQIGTEKFDIEWIEGVFNAVEKLTSVSELPGKIFCEQFKTDWLANVNLNTIDYTIICGVIYYLKSFPNANKLDVERIAMFLKNLCYNVDNSKNPDAATIRAIEGVKKLCETGNMDIINLLGVKELDEHFFTKTDRRKFEILRDNPNERLEWENIFWSITNNEPLSKYIQGDCGFIFEIVKEDKSIKTFKRYLNGFIEDVLKKEDDYETANQLRISLLKYGDIRRFEGHGNGIPRYNLNFPRNINEHTDKLDILKGFLDKKILDEEETNNMPEWRQILVSNEYSKDIFEYINENKILIDEDSSRVVLLAGTNFVENKSMELQIFLLNKSIPISWICNYKTCVIEFSKSNDEIKLLKEDAEEFFLDIVYNAEGSNWSFLLGHRSQKEFDSPLENTVGWAQSPDSGWLRYRYEFQSNSYKVSIKENVDACKKEIEKLLNISFDESDMNKEQ